jgi:hypothetical protein
MNNLNHVRWYVGLAREANHIALACMRERKWGVAADMIEARNSYIATAREWWRRLKK